MKLSWCYQQFVDGKKKVSMDREFVENLSSRQRAKKIGSMDRRSYRASIEMKPRNLVRSRNCWTSIKKRPRNLDGSKICRYFIEKAESTGKFLNGSKIRRGFYQGQRKKLDRNGIYWRSIEKLSSLKKRSLSRRKNTRR